MLQRRLVLTVSAIIQFGLGIFLTSPSAAQEWQLRKLQGTLNVVDLTEPTASVMFNYAEALVPY